MNKTLSFIRLDFLTVKPYLTLKNLLIFIAVAVFVIISTGSASTAIGIIMAFAALYASYPFAVGEKSSMDLLYATLSIKRNMVVLGRYLFAVILDLCAGIFIFIFSFIFLTILQKDFNAVESLAVLLIMFLFFSLILAVQLPIYFRLGYTKAKFLAYLPFAVLPLMILFFSSSLIDVLSAESLAAFYGWLMSNVLIAVLIGCAIWLGVMALSYKISLSFYRKRDF